MWELLERIFGAGFMPHGHCYLWSPAMVGLQVSSNFLIGVAYLSIACTLAVLVRRIRDLPFVWAYVAFGTFILSCGLTHWFDVVTVWHPIYWADAAVRTITAIASLLTAVLILPMLPQAVALASSARLAEERGIRLESALAELEVAHQKLTEREQAAQRRAELSQEQARSLIETMPQLAWIGTADGRNLFFNQRWIEYTGLAPEQLADVGLASVVDSETLSHVTEQWQQSLATHKAFESEMRLRRADGEYRWFLVRAVPVLGTSGSVISWVGTCTDIHAQRLLREEALHTAQMKDEFIATISHELRTPLNAILGWTKVLQADPAMQAKALGAIERNAAAQAQLIGDLLDASRILSGKMRMEVALVNPADPVEAALESVRPSAEAKEIEIIAEIDPHAGLVWADSGRLQQVVWNLITNSLKFTPKQGKIAIRLAKSASHVEITVSDTGIGIGPAFLPHIFDRFSQEDGSIRRKHGGLGLGLSIAKDLTELHGGHISVKSDGEGQGATFTVKLPLAAAGPVPRKRPGVRSSGTRVLVLESPPELKGLRLLLVEDEADSREMAATVLGQCGVTVVAAATAEEALKLLAEQSFDVIVSDIGLPGQDGYQFIGAVRKQERLAKIPAAALTAHAHIEDRKRAHRAGFQMYLPKPVEPAELIAVATNLARMGKTLQA